MEINLLPHTPFVARHFPRLLLASAVFLVAVASAGYPFYRAHTRALEEARQVVAELEQSKAALDRQATVYRQKRTAIEKERAAVRAQTERIRATQLLKAHRYRWSALVEQASRAFPPGTAVFRIEASVDRLVGYAAVPALTDLAPLARRLSELPAVTDAVVERATDPAAQSLQAIPDLPPGTLVVRFRLELTDRVEARNADGESR